MLEKIGLWLFVAIAERLAKKYLTHERGQTRRTQVVDYLITRAEKGKKNKTNADENALLYFAGLFKSERLKQAIDND